MKKRNRLTKSAMAMLLSCALINIVLTPVIFAQAGWNPDIVDDAASGIISITTAIISDSFTPMTHYQKGDWTTSVVPAYFNIKRAFDSPELTGDNLKGQALGLGGGYSLSERWMVYGIFAGMNVKGKMQGGIPGSIYYDKYTIDTEFRLYTLLAGLGFDIIGDNRYFSVPVYLGGYLQKYSADLILTPGEPLPFISPDIGITGDDYLYGYSICIAVSANVIGMLRVTPYFLYGNSFAKTRLTAELREEIGFPIPSVINYDIDVSRTGGSMMGLRVAYLSKSAWSLSVSVGSLVASKTEFFNKKYANGMDITSVVVAFTYGGNSMN